MPKVRCHYEDCVFLDEGFCSAAYIEIDPDQGCLTYRPEGEFLEEEEDLMEGVLDEDLWDEDDLDDEEDL